MSREVIIRIRDDLDRSDADETIEFSYRGVDYEIDLSNANVERFDKSVKEFIEVARRVERVVEMAAAPKATRRSAAAALTGKYQGPPSPVAKQQRKDIRAWANANGYKTQDRGMIGSVIVDAFLLANPHVTLRPDAVPNYTAHQPLVEKVLAQDAQDGLIEAAALLTQHHDRGRMTTLELRALRTKIRNWANENGFEQAMQGHIKHEVLDAYYEVHPNEVRLDA